MYQHTYQFTMTFKNPLHRSKLDDPVVQKQIQQEVIRLNSYYQNATKQQVSCKKYLDISFGQERMSIILETEYPLTNPERKGQCLRQFSIFLLNAGLGQYLTDHEPKKLLSGSADFSDLTDAEKDTVSRVRSEPEPEWVSDSQENQRCGRVLGPFFGVGDVFDNYRF